jgi:hypothetical protein
MTRSSVHESKVSIRRIAATALVAAVVAGAGVIGATDAGARTASRARFTDYCTFAKAVEKTNAASANPAIAKSKAKYKRAWLALRAVDKRVPTKLPVEVRAAWKVVLASDAKLTTIYEKHDYDTNKALKDPKFTSEVGPAVQAALKTIADYHRSVCSLTSTLAPESASG